MTYSWTVSGDTKNSEGSDFYKYWKESSKTTYVASDYLNLFDEVWILQKISHIIMAKYQ